MTTATNPCTTKAEADEVGEREDPVSILASDRPSLCLGYLDPTLAFRETHWARLHIFADTSFEHTDVLG